MAQLKYDASIAPEPAQWLALDEQQAEWLVRQYHASPRCGHPRAENPVLHATIHAIVENQIAMGDETPARSTLERLMREGLSRHDAVHAIGSVLAKHMYGLLGGNRPGGQAGTDLYYDGLRRLTAATWWRGAGDDAREDSPEWLAEGAPIADWSAATPDEIVAALCVAVPHFPREALRAAERAKEHIAERLLRLIAEAHQSTREGASPPGNGHIFAMLLLAELEDPRAFDVIADLFTLPVELCREVGGDFVTEDLGRVLASVCGGRIEPLARIIEDRTRWSFVRGAALAALCALVQRQHVRREAAVAYLVRLTRETLVDERSEIWNEVASAVLDLYAYELFADVRRLIDERLIDSFCLARQDVDYAERKGLARAMAALDRNVHLRPVRDVVAETAWWHSYSDSAKYAPDADPDDCDCATAKPSAMTPVRVIKVGRNDPCPCGSGKKYKKCCLGTD